MANTITIIKPKNPPDASLPNSFEVNVQIGWDMLMSLKKEGKPFEVKYTVLEPQMSGNTVTYVAVYNETQVVIFGNQPVVQNVSPVNASVNATILVTLIEVELILMQDPRITVHDSDSTTPFNIAAPGTVGTPP
jgi:hypothetical protein